MAEESCDESKTNDEISDDEQQLIRLSLKKPKLWNWELTTSKSSSSIAFPTIQLFDENSQTLLAVAHEADFVASSKQCRSAMSSEASSLRSARSKDSFKIKISRDAIDVGPLKTSDDAERKQKSCSFVGRTKRSVSTTSVRSRSSILERISEMKQDISTDESEVEDHPAKIDKKYSYRTSKVGTLLVPKENNSASNDLTTRRRPRKPYQVNSEVDKLMSSCSGE